MYFTCDNIGSIPDKGCNKCMYYFTFILLLVFMPLVVLFVYGCYCVEKLEIGRYFANPGRCTYNKGCQSILFIIFLPWNLIILSLCIIIFSISGVIMMPIMLIPAYYQNSKRFRATVRYWNGKHRFDSKVKEEKMQKEDLRKASIEHDDGERFNQMVQRLLQHRL